LPEHDDEQIAWARETADVIAPYSLAGAAYVNYMAADERSDDVRAAFGAEKFARLQTIKATFDPENLFRLNQNVPPAR
jgi:FAD/FMN-containing dehydrogenase